MYFPSLEEFRKKSTEGNLVPVYREILADMETPVSALCKIDNGEYAFLLESVEGGENIAQYSFLGSNPSQIFWSKGNTVTTVKNGVTQQRDNVEDPFEELRKLMGEFQPVSVEGLPRFHGGAVGFLTYDMVRFFEDLPDDPSGLMLAYLSEKVSLLDEKQMLALTFDANPGSSLETLDRDALESEHLFVQPKATVAYDVLTDETYTQRLARLNQRRPDSTPDKWTMLLTKAKLRIKPLDEILPGVLVLKRVLELNGSSLPLTIQDFKPGRQILFPTKQGIETNYHVIDSKVAQLFYEVILYYPAFEETFKYEVKRIYEELDNVIQ